MDVNSDVCRPVWDLNGNICPYGYPVDVPFSNWTYRHGANFIDIIAGILSCAPLLLMLYTHIGLYYRRKCSQLFGALLFYVVGAVIFIGKVIAVQKRPQGTCLTSCGMPSGHSAESFAFVVWFFLTLNESYYLTLPLIFVPWSRWFLLDHSFAQITVGSCIGVLLAFGWFRIAVFLCERRPTGMNCVLTWFQDDLSFKRSSTSTVEDEHLHLSSSPPLTPQPEVESKV